MNAKQKAEQIRARWDKAANPKEFWTANADMLSINGAPKWMVRASRNYAKRLRA